MAAPIGHIFLALRMLAGPLHGLDEQAFLIGTSFPDIRYWAQAPREYTHKSNINFDDILKETDAFKAGVLFHSFVDTTREEFFKKNNFNALVRFANKNGYLIKNTEDIILFERLTNKSFIKYFDTVLTQEKELIPHSTLIKKWHTTLQRYFAQGPTPLNLYTLMNQHVLSNQNYKLLFIQLFYRVSKRLSASVAIRKHILSFYDNFEQIIGLVPYQTVIPEALAA